MKTLLKKLIGKNIYMIYTYHNSNISYNDENISFENHFIINDLKFNIQFFDSDFYFTLNKLIAVEYKEINNVLSNQVTGVSRYLIGGKRKIEKINVLGFSKEKLIDNMTQFSFEINNKSTANFLHFIFDTKEELFIDSSEGLFSVNILKNKSKIHSTIKELELILEWTYPASSSFER